MKPIIIVTFATFLFACNGPAQHSKRSEKIVRTNNDVNNQWIFDKVSGSTLKFKSGKTFNTNLFSLKYIDQISNGHKAPFLIFSGRDCDECDANISLYIQSPSDGRLIVENGGTNYNYPGIERDFENDSLLYKGRVFYGQVLPGEKGVIWYQNQLMENNSWKATTFLVDFNNGQKRESLLNGQSKLNLTLDLLKRGLCKEIPGMDYKSEP